MHHKNLHLKKPGQALLWVALVVGVKKTPTERRSGLRRARGQAANSAPRIPSGTAQLGTRCSLWAQHCPASGEPNNFGLPGHISPALILNAKGTDKMHRYTNPTHRERLTWGFIACIGSFLHHQVTVPNINWSIFLWGSHWGRETLTPGSGTSVLTGFHFSTWSEPFFITNSFSEWSHQKREPKEQLCSAPGSGLPGTALHQMQQRKGRRRTLQFHRAPRAQGYTGWTHLFSLS